jgi:hypothetical protein
MLQEQKESLEFGNFYTVCEVHRWNRSGFLTTETGTGLKKSDRTGLAGLPVTDRTGLAGLPVTGRSNFYTDTNYAS